MRSSGGSGGTIRVPQRRGCDEFYKNPFRRKGSPVKSEQKIRSLLLLLIPVALSATYGVTWSSPPHPSVSLGIGFPIALAAFPSGNLIALESRGAIYLIAPGAQHARKLKDNVGRIGGLVEPGNE